MSTPADLLGMARQLLDRASPETAGLWPRAAALLGRQALEMAVDEFWAARRIPLDSCPTHQQLICLREYLGDADLAGRVHLAWNGLSRACHHHPYELAPTAGELAVQFETVGEFLALMSQEDGAKVAPEHQTPSARSTLAKAEASIRPILYRPFDVRVVAYHPLLLGEPRPDVMRHLLGGQLALLTTRRVTGRPYDNVFVCRGLVEYKAATHDRNTQVFPLYLEEQAIQGRGNLFLPVTVGGQRPNLDTGIFTEWKKEVGFTTAENLFQCIYAILFSPRYRERFREELQQDYARVPRPRTRTLALKLMELGAMLIALHLLESPLLNLARTRCSGNQAPRVAKVSWSDDTAWLDDARSTGFQGISEAVWNLHVGGYQVCEKWLKDRKGRALSDEDITHYNRVVVALGETIRLMQEVDAVIERHGGWPEAFQTGDAKAPTTIVLPFDLRAVNPTPETRYKTCVPIVPLKAAAGAFGDPQRIEDDGFEWIEVGSRHRLRPGMYVSQVVGKSMEPAIPDGAWCLFRAPVEGTRHGKTVLVQLRDAKDPETGERYTVKRYESEKAADGESWRHERITLRPVNPEFEPIVLTGKDAAELHVIAELVEVLGGEA